MKLKLFISQLDDANMNPFPHLKEQIEGAVHNGNLRKCTTKIKSLPDSIESRFYNFAESGTRLENKFNIENEIQGCHIGEFIARFQKSGEFWKRLATDILVWRFGEFLAIFWKHLVPNFLVWQNVRPVYLHVFAYIFIRRFTIFKLADGFKIHDIKWKCKSFESRSIVLNTSYQKCLQNVETDYLEIFAKC